MWAHFFYVLFFVVVVVVTILLHFKLNIYYHRFHHNHDRKVVLLQNKIQKYDNKVFFFFWILLLWVSLWEYVSVVVSIVVDDEVENWNKRERSQISLKKKRGILFQSSNWTQIKKKNPTQRINNN